MTRKVVVTCAVTGGAPFSPKHPAFPVTPKQISGAVIEAAKAGAAIAHIHVRDPETGKGSRDLALYKEVVSRIRESSTDVVINLTAGMGGVLLPNPDDESLALPESDIATAEERIEHLRDCLPEIASLDVTTGNQVEGNAEYVYLNTPRTLRLMAQYFQELNVKPEIEVFHSGDIEFAKSLMDEGFIDNPPLFQLVLGVPWGAPATPDTMMYMRNRLPGNAIWTGMGIARSQMPMVAQSILLDGNVRVGLEDNLYLSRGVFATNGQLVERACSVIEALGHQPATPAEARTLLLSNQDQGT